MSNRKIASFIGTLGVLIAQSASAQGVYGDLPGDGVPSVTDIQCMSKVVQWMMAEDDEPAPACLAYGRSVADLDCNGEINVVDLKLSAEIAKNHLSGGALHPSLDGNENNVVDACEPPPLFGDVTGDGALTISDLQCTVQVLAWSMSNSGAPAPPCLSGDAQIADVDCSGSVGLVDVYLSRALIIRALNGTPLNPAVDSDDDGITDSCQ